MNRIYPNKVKIDNDSNICFVADHMPPFIIDFSINHLKEFYGYNSLNKILEQSMPHVDTLVFDHYQSLNLNKDYNTFYIEIFFQKTIQQYLSLNKNNSVDFSKKTKKFNYLSNKPREARILTSAWIAKTYSDQNDYNYTQSYQGKDFEQLLDEFILIESLPLESTFLPKKWISTGLPIEKKSTNNFSIFYGNNSTNFYTKIKKQITPTVFSIVMEPAFWEHGCLLTEKYINAVLGGTIPIVNGYRVYESIERMGFDTFDDIIDTSAQFEKNSVLHVYNLLEKNKNILDNALEIIKDQSVQKRLINNIKILENYDYNLARSRYSPAQVNFLTNFE